MNIKKGDTVKILYGKDAGKTGLVLSVSVKLGRVIVDGVNKYKKHIKGDGKQKKSEIIDVEKGLPLSKVILVCPNCNKSTRVKRERKGEGYIRICKRCNKEFVQAKVVEKKEAVKKAVKKTPAKKVVKKKVTKKVKK